MSEELHKVTYRCTKRGCGNIQTIAYFNDDLPLPVTCCVKCRAGFGMDIAGQIAHHLGMFPITDSVGRFTDTVQ